MRIIDLSVELAVGMPQYPSPYLPPMQLTPLASHRREARSTQLLTVGTHVSTHVDAPFHAVPTGLTLDRVPLDLWFGVTRVVHFGDRDKSNPLDVADIEAIPGLSTVRKILLDTGWARRTWGTSAYFTEGPFLTRAAAHFIASQELLQLIGTDFPNIDSASDTVPEVPAPNHGIVLGRGIVLLENLLNLEGLEDEVVLSAAPPRLVGGDGCPVRAIAISPVPQEYR